MALPGDLLVKYRAHANQQLLLEVENLCRTLRPDLWETYFPSTYTYGHSSDPNTANLEPVSGALVAGTIDDKGRDSVALTRGQRLARCIGILCETSWATSDAATRGAISTVIGNLL
jgi:hypothetical protein